MIKIQIKRLFNHIFPYLFFLSYFLIPIYCGIKFYSPQIIKFIVLIYFFCACAVFVLLKQAKKKKYLFSIENEKLTEDINILNGKIKTHSIITSVLGDKIRRYSALKALTEKLVQKVSLDDTADLILTKAYTLIAHSKGRAILYLVDTKKQELNFFASYGGVSSVKDTRETVGARGADVFDDWIFKHQVPLLIEDTKKDFRFDAKVSFKAQHPIGSLISTPLIVGKRIVGILRLEDEKISSFSSDDLRFLSVFSDLAALSLDNSKLYEHTQHLAITDGLTGLYLRQYFMVCLNAAIKETINTGVAFSILMIDIDRFKKYNDKFGHISGDIVLGRIAKVLMKECPREGAILSRYGGEEFIVLLSGIDKTGAVKIAEKLRKKIAQEKIVLRRTKTHVTVSIGISTCPEDGRLADELLKISDIYLYKAKQKGRNGTCFC